MADATPEDTGTLGELIRQLKGRRSYQDLAREAGGSPAFTRWQQLATEQIRNAPEPKTVQSIAEVLGVPVHTVWDAVGRSLGLDLGDQPSMLASRIPPGAESLTQRQVDLIVGVAGELIATKPKPAVEPATAPANVRPLRTRPSTTPPSKRAAAKTTQGKTRATKTRGV